MGLSALIRASIRSPALIATMAFAVGGVGFALAQLLLARALQPAEFALISLVLSINQVGFAAGTLGIEIPINRHRIPASRALLTRTVTCAAPIAALCGIVAAVGYGIRPAVAVLVGVTIIASSANLVAASLYRSTRQFAQGLMLTQLQNYALLAIALIALAMPSPSAVAVTAMIAVAYAVGASIGWISLRRRDAAAPDEAPSRAYVAEGLFALGYTVAAMIMVQFERLIIPRTLTMSDLAEFSVAAALAASPFRMLQLGVGFTLLPRLRACQNVAQIRSLLAKEALIVAVLVMALIAAVWLVTPYMLSVFLKQRYHLADSLIISIFAVGIVRIGSSFAVACVQGLGHSAQFRQLTVCAWISLVTSLICAFAFSRFGLGGVVYGVGIGWLLLALSAATIAARAIRSKVAAHEGR